MNRFLQITIFRPINFQMRRFLQITIFRPENFQILAVLLCTLIFLFGVALGIANPIPEIVNPSKNLYSVICAPLLTTSFLFFINHYVNGRINKAEKKYERKITELQREIPDPYRVSQDLEFLSIVFEEGHNKFPQGFNYLCFSDQVREFREKSSLEDETIEYNKKLGYRKQAVEGLEKGFKYDEECEDAYPFVSLIKEAGNHAVGIPHYRDHEWVEGVYLDIKMYLKAWLICSLKYGVIIPIEPFHRSYLDGEGKHKYKGIETYVKAIRYIKDKVLTDTAILPYFKDAPVRKIVQEYLGKLIDLLQYQDVPLKHSIKHSITY